MGRKAGQKQEEAEEVGYEHTLQNRELVIDNTKSNKCVSTERCRIFLGENTTQNLRREVRVASEGKKHVAVETGQSVISTSQFHTESILLV